MRHLTIESLCQFCADQFKEFVPDAWIVHSGIDGRFVALAANYLAKESWYGHEDELARLVARPDMMIDSSSDFYSEAQAMGMDLRSFSTKVREKVARCENTY